MSITLYVVTAVLAVMLVYSAIMKLSSRPRVVESYGRVGVPARRLPLLAMILLAGAAGLLVGWAWTPIGLVAALGLVAYFVLALTAHARHRDLAHAATPLIVLVLAVTAGCLYGLR
ncbi:MAG: DoxX family protein [Nocardioidaceae bacterium]